MTYHRGLKAFVAAVVAGYSIAGAACTAVAQYSGYAGPGDGMVSPMMGNAFGDSGGVAYSMPDGPAYSGCGGPPGGCGECFTPACPKGGWSAGMSVYVLSPYSQSTAFLSTDNTTAATTTTNISWNYSASPAIWVGYRTAGGLKTRARFFYFDQISNLANLNSPDALVTIAVPGQLQSQGIITGFINGTGGPFVVGTNNTTTGTASTRLFMNIGDIEAGVYEAAAGQYSFQVYAGARYAYLSSNTALAALNIDAVGGTTTTATAGFFHSFNGGGPTLFAQGYRQIGRSGFAWFGNVRGSLLVGSITEAVSFTAITTNGAVPASQSFNNSTVATLPVAEFESGLEHRLPCGRKVLFARVSAVDMTFFNFGGPMDTASNLSLFGGRASIGCNY